MLQVEVLVGWLGSSGGSAFIHEGQKNKLLDKVDIWPPSGIRVSPIRREIKPFLAPPMGQLRCKGLSSSLNC